MIKKIKLTENKLRNIIRKVLSENIIDHQDYIKWQSQVPGSEIPGSMEEKLLQDFWEKCSMKDAEYDGFYTDPIETDDLQEALITYAYQSGFNSGWTQNRSSYKSDYYSGQSHSYYDSEGVDSTVVKLAKIFDIDAEKFYEDGYENAVYRD